MESNRRGRDRTPNEEGAALMVALIFILVVGLIVTALLTKSGTVMSTDFKIRDTTQAQYGADAGVDRALQVLRSDLANATPTLCPATTSPTMDDFGTGDSSGLAIAGNSHLVHYRCQTVNGSVAIPGASINSNFAIVTTGSALDSLTAKNGSGNPLPINGSVYLGGPEDTTVNGIKKELDVSNAGVVEYDQGDRAACTTNLNSLTTLVVKTANFAKVCGAQTPFEAVPQIALPAAPSTTAKYVNPAPVDVVTGGHKCRVFLPARYTTAPSLLTGNQGANYFLSGLYYFYNPAGSLTFNVDAGQTPEVYAGQPNTARNDAFADTDMASSDCRAFANKDSSAGRAATIATLTPLFITQDNIDLTSYPNAIWQHGVQFVMGNQASIVVGKGALSLASPDPSGPVSPGRSVSLIAARQDKWFASTTTSDSANLYTPWSAGGTVLDSSTSNSQLVVNGKVLAPDADVVFFGTHPATDKLASGVVARKLSVDASSGVQADQFIFNSDGSGPTNNPPPQRRTVKITSCVDPGNPNANCIVNPTSTTVTEVAIATIDNFGTRPIRVFSWQVN